MVEKNQKIMGHVSSADAENGSRNVIPIDPRLI